MPREATSKQEDPQRRFCRAAARRPALCSPATCAVALLWCQPYRPSLGQEGSSSSDCTFNPPLTGSRLLLRLYKYCYVPRFKLSDPAKISAFFRRHKQQILQKISLGRAQLCLWAPATGGQPQLPSLALSPLLRLC